MTGIVISPKALSDLEEIYTFTAGEWGLDQADKYQDDLYYGFHLIEQNHTIGAQYSFAEMDYRVLHVNRHLIFYREESHSTIIIRVLHEKMDLKRYL